MRLALLIGANPRLYQSGATTVIKPGKWKITGDMIQDSEICVKNHTLQLSLHDEVELDVHTGFTVEFTKRGSEKVISVFAERIA